MKKFLLFLLLALPLLAFAQAPTLDGTEKVPVIGAVNWNPTVNQLKNFVLDSLAAVAGVDSTTYSGDSAFVWSGGIPYWSGNLTAQPAGQVAFGNASGVGLTSHERLKVDATNGQLQIGMIPTLGYGSWRLRIYSDNIENGFAQIGNATSSVKNTMRIYANNAVNDTSLVSLTNDQVIWRQRASVPISGAYTEAYNIQFYAFGNHGINNRATGFRLLINDSSSNTLNLFDFNAYRSTMLTKKLVFGWPSPLNGVGLDDYSFVLNPSGATNRFTIYNNTKTALYSFGVDSLKMYNKKITNLADPTNDMDAVNKRTLDAVTNNGLYTPAVVLDTDTLLNTYTFKFTMTDSVVHISGKIRVGAQAATQLLSGTLSLPPGIISDFTSVENDVSGAVTVNQSDAITLGLPRLSARAYADTASDLIGFSYEPIGNGGINRRNFVDFNLTITRK